MLASLAEMRRQEREAEEEVHRQEDRAATATVAASDREQDRRAEARSSPSAARCRERLTATIGLLLVGLLVVEAATTLSLHDSLAVHLFLGLALLPVISAKLASTGWRFVRYYAHDAAYRLKGPPQLFLRALAPLLVTSTVVLFGTGVAFLVVGGRGGLLLTAHAASFIVWGVLVSCTRSPISGVCFGTVSSTGDLARDGLPARR